MIKPQHTSSRPSKPPKPSALGHHWLIELYDCQSALLEQTSTIETLMNEAARIAGATIVSSNFHQFSPYGVSGVVVISESHLTIHTWPEHGYAAVDIFTCGNTVKAEPAVRFLEEKLQAKRVETKYFERGMVMYPVAPAAESRPSD